MKTVEEALRDEIHGLQALLVEMDVELEKARGLEYIDNVALVPINGKYRRVELESYDIEMAMNFDPEPIYELGRSSPVAYTSNKSKLKRINIHGRLIDKLNDPD